MDKLKKYDTPTAFRRALEDRLKQKAKNEGLDLQRLMREVAFDRLLARLFARKDAAWILKGGYALELRMKEARATKDIDLALRHSLG
ncbi:MAG: nucleotidyl transferase AbiEii/AbiGii toxin family protein, partial [Elusimicrobiota bacterium]|nr:nucleotidyl transferase AbiEii/AbiGii toxin family protein [Elusimicrobiota bacterium]